MMLTSTFNWLQRCRWHQYGSSVPPKSAKSREILRKFELTAVQTSRSSKVIDLGANRKRLCNFPLVINIVTLTVSPTVFEILTYLARK